MIVRIWKRFAGLFVNKKALSQMTTDGWTYWTDYVAKKLNEVEVADQQQVWTDWLQERVNITVLRPLKIILKDEFVRSENDKSSTLLIFSVSICCAIEAMGKYLKGTSSGSGVRFKAFLEYMDRRYKSEKIGDKFFENYLWKDFRNGIAHGFAIAQGNLSYPATMTTSTAMEQTPKRIRF